MRVFKFRTVRPGEAEVLFGKEVIGLVRKQQNNWCGFDSEGTQAPRNRRTRNECGLEVYAMYARNKKNQEQLENSDSDA